MPSRVKSLNAPSSSLLTTPSPYPSPTSTPLFPYSPWPLRPCWGRPSQENTRHFRSLSLCRTKPSIRPGCSKVCHSSSVIVLSAPHPPQGKRPSPLLSRQGSFDLSEIAD